MLKTKAKKMSVLDIKDALNKDHYLVAAYDSNEAFNQWILVVIPELTAPTWVLRRSTRKLNRHNVMALAVPSVSALTLELAQELTRMGTDYITVREFPKEARQGGYKQAGERVLMPWER